MDRARRFSREVLVPHRREFDRTDVIPPEVMRSLGAAGFLGINLPKSYGGAEVSTLTLARTLEELAVGCVALAEIMAVHLSVACAPILAWGTEEQRQRWLPEMVKGRWLGAFGLTEPGVGSDAQRLTTRYERAADGFVLNGSKMFITNARSAEVVLVFATRDPSLGSKGISCFVVQKGTPGFSVAQMLDKLGTRGSETTELVLEGCRVPLEAQLGPEGAGFKVAMSALDGGRIGIAACSLGVARAALEAAASFVGPESEDWKKSALARCFVDVEASRALVEKAARQRDAGEDFTAAASAAKLFASQAAFRVASKGLEIAGREVFDRDHPSILEQLFRDARVLTIVEGATEIQEMLLGRRLAGERRPSTATGAEPS